ncbi:U-box domain-containing protein 57-like [Carex rostrata]
MAAQYNNNSDKVFVVLPETDEDELSLLLWVLNYFSQDKTKIIIIRVITVPLEELPDSHWINESLQMDLVMELCATYKFQVEKLVHKADDIADGVVQIIAKHGISNLVMGSTANSDMTDLASETAIKVRREANLSCKLWFVSNGNLIFTRDPVVNLASTSSGSSSESIIEEGDIDVDAFLSLMLHETSIKADNLEKMVEEFFGAHKKMAHLVNKLAKDSQQKEQEIRDLKENLEREKQEKDQLRREIEENEHKKIEEIEQITKEIDLLRIQRDEDLNQIQVAHERRLALEEQVSDLEFVVNELCMQKEKMHYGSSTALNSEFSLQELQQATENFSESLKIGEGAFGPVYKGSLRRTTVAIKLLRSQSIQGLSQFQQEITILTKVRHPNLVNLIGACSEVSALVYEYLSNGSLEDRLTCANNTPPLTWYTRTRIIGEICLALIFLHSNKPQLVVHGDLKPGNILLDTNLVSKLSDFGISRLLKQPDTNSTAFHETSRPSGTLSYNDPEYYSTGILTPKSDIYSLGIIILRLLTGKPPMNIARQVEDAMSNDMLSSVIDESAGAWPFEKAKELAKIALRCVEISRSQRPDLVNEVWVVVEPLMKAACTYVELAEESIPSHFICPIYQEVMKDPCIAADGFTYDAEAIKQWLSTGHNTSPMTNLSLPHHDLIPNRVLRSAIHEWLQSHPQS